VAAVQHKDSKGNPGVYGPSDDPLGFLKGMAVDKDDTYVVETVPAGLTVNYFPGGSHTIAIDATATIGSKTIGGRWHDKSANVIHPFSKVINVT